MSSLSITILQVLTGGLAFGIGFLSNKSSLKLWRIFVGFFVGFGFSWIFGIMLWGTVFMSNDKVDRIVSGMPRSFLAAIVGAGIGVYAGRRRAKVSVSQ